MQTQSFKYTETSTVTQNVNKSYIENQRGEQTRDSFEKNVSLASIVSIISKSEQRVANSRTCPNVLI